MTYYITPAVENILLDLKVFREAASTWNTNALCSAIARGYVEWKITEGSMVFRITKLGALMLENSEGDFFGTREYYMGERL